jgi:hypothetical protein
VKLIVAPKEEGVYEKGSDFALDVGFLHGSDITGSDCLRLCFPGTKRGQRCGRGSNCVRFELSQ